MTSQTTAADPGSRPSVIGDVPAAATGAKVSPPQAFPKTQREADRALAASDAQQAGLPKTKPNLQATIVWHPLDPPR